MEKKKKKPYIKPQIIYDKKIETLAIVCDSARGGVAGCRLVGSCARPRDE